MNPPDQPTDDENRPHVLVVDDDEDLCELLALRLEHHGFRASTEATRRGAIEVLEREGVDAVLLDLRLQDDDGLEVLTVLQTRSLDLPVIMLTAHGSIDYAVEAMRRGAYGFLTKPFDDHELIQKLEHAVERIRLRREVEGLRRLVGESASGHRLLGSSAKIEAVRERIARIAPSDVSVLILGESGTGKEVAARALHAQSARRDGPFVGLNCGALPGDLLESELFGHRRGAFTGAHADKDGLFAAAGGGTLFLDEIGDAPSSVQVKLLRVLEERSFTPVGAVEPRSTDVRVVAATNRDLAAEVKAGRFREDLFYRLHVVPLEMPPLRERLEDVPLLAELFLARAAAQQGHLRPHLGPDALSVLLEHSWPGNVRELANVVQGGALLSIDGHLRASHVLAVMPRTGAPSAPSPAAAPSLAAFPSLPAELSPLLGSEAALPSMRIAREAFDRLYLMEVLRRSGGNVSAAAKLAGRNRTDFHDLLRRYEIVAADFRTS